MDKKIKTAISGLQVGQTKVVLCQNYAELRVWQSTLSQYKREHRTDGWDYQTSGKDAPMGTYNLVITRIG